MNKVKSQSKFKQSLAQANKKAKSDDNNLSWHFKEPKNNLPTSWYVKVSLFFVILVLLAIFWMKSYTAAAVFVIVFLTLLVYIKRPQEKVKFMIDDESVYINDKAYQINNYKYFTVRQQKDYFVISLMPIKRLSTELVINFEEKIGEELVDRLAAKIPLEPYEESFIDNLIRKIGL